MLRLVRDLPDPVINVEDLAVPSEFPADRFTGKLVVVFHDIGLDRHPVERRFFQDRKVPDPCKGHVKCPGDRRRSQGQHVQIGLHLFDLFLVSHAEALLLIDDKKARILKLHVLRKQPVRPDDDIDAAVL